MNENLDAAEIESQLADIVAEYLVGPRGRVTTNADYGVLTTDRGLVIWLESGQCFQLDIHPCPQWDRS